MALPIWLFILASVIKSAIVLGVLLTAVAYTVWLERKVVGHMQNRWGPTRVGPFGLLQPAADGLKFLFKEDLTPPHVYKPLFIAAPLIAVIFALTSISVIPFGNAVTIGGYSIPLQITTDVNTGLLLILGVTSIGVYGVALAGMVVEQQVFPARRTARQRADGELRDFTGTLAGGRADYGGQLQPANDCGIAGRIFLGIHSALEYFRRTDRRHSSCYLMAAYAETNRIPFDLPEAETELVAGYHTEYSAMKFAMFFMAEYANMITVACLATLMFFGGWLGPMFGPPILQAILPVVWFAAKVFVFLFLYIWVRGTLPRFRYDQLMAFGWKFLLPLALANLIATAIAVAW